MRYLPILFLLGCTASVHTVDQPTTFTTPADSAYGDWYGPELPIVFNPDCDSAKVAAEILSRTLADIQAQLDGYYVDVDVTLKEGKRKDALIDGLRKQVSTLRAQVGVLVNEPAKEQPIPQKFLDERKALIQERDQLRENQERHGFFWFLGAGLSVFLAGALAGFILPKLLLR